MRIEPKSNYPWYLSFLFKLQKRRYGETLIPATVWARAPRLFWGFSLFVISSYKDRPGIPASLRTMINTTISQLNDCPFCIDMHSYLCKKNKVDDERIKSLPHFQESSLYTNHEKIALEYVIAVVKKEVTDELFERVKQEFNDDEIVELTGLAVLQNSSNLFNLALKMPSQGFCNRKSE